jgi:hypothetical protein
VDGEISGGCAAQAKRDRGATAMGGIEEEDGGPIGGQHYADGAAGRKLFWQLIA